jgi:LmbE family N-acetylglucosaminyl deacetylase
MSDNRRDTLFTLRYAERVLEREARFWQTAHTALRVVTIFAGTFAVGALLAQHRDASVIVGLVFAALQALDYGVDLARRAEAARAARRLYADVLARRAGLDDAALQAGYEEARAREEVVPLGALRRAAYNDVLVETGSDPAYAYTLSRWDRVLASLG